MVFPAVFDRIETYDPEDLSSVTEIDPPFASTFNKCVRWWTVAEPAGEMTLEELQQLQRFSSELVQTVATNKKTGVSTSWPPKIKSHFQAWGQAARAWDKEVERVLKELDLSVKSIWFRAAPSERGATGMPHAHVWDPHHAKICMELFPELPGLETPTGNVAEELTTWLVAWLTDYIHTSRKIKEQMEKSPNTTQRTIEGILGPNFWQTPVLDVSGLKMPNVTALNRLLIKWTDQIEWTITLADEEGRLKKQLGPDPSPQEISARWATLSDSAKMVEWAGYAYGQTEAIVNGVRRQGSVRKEIELEILVSDTLKTAILHGRMLGKGVELTSTANIRTATEEEISEFDHSLTENLQMWGQGDVQAPWEALRTLWNSEHDLDHDADDNWRENFFLTGTALGVETGKSLNDGQLCDLLGWSPEKGIPAAFRTHVHKDPVMPPVKDGSEASERVKRVQIHWHQKELEHFRSQPNIPVLTISNVAATGLNIAYCSPLILHDVGWSKVHSNQIVGRIHRQGQRQQTYIFQMASDRTIDTLLLANGRNKGHLLNTFLSVGRNRSEFIAAAMAHVMINLNNTADADEIWEYLEEESGLSHLDVQH
ncbi:hypothetical protein B0H16DRAFT_1738937 [Mycena metata]|uniref:Helicase C-terminal domain-containing protein n=1 Tax=Mycena metata TaxID=1033252 RepID=A0AAD7MJZ7_9AGAR|nr:hypothetical protein B0H16DRAFT_1738937 [Mycena metata]